MANNADRSQDVVITMKGLKTVGKVTTTTLSGKISMENLVGKPETIHPVTGSLEGSGNTISVAVPSKGFMVLRF